VEEFLLIIAQGLTCKGERGSKAWRGWYIY